MVALSPPKNHVKLQSISKSSRKNQRKVFGQYIWSRLGLQKAKTKKGPWYVLMYLRAEKSYIADHKRSTDRTLGTPKLVAMQIVVILY